MNCSFIDNESVFILSNKIYASSKLYASIYKVFGTSCESDIILFSSESDIILFSSESDIILSVSWVLSVCKSWLLLVFKFIVLLLRTSWLLSVFKSILLKSFCVSLSTIELVDVTQSAYTKHGWHSYIFTFLLSNITESIQRLIPLILI